MKKKIKTLSISFASMAALCVMAIFLSVVGLTFVMSNSAAGRGTHGEVVNTATASPIVDWAGEDGTGIGSEVDPYIIKSADTFVSRLRGDTNASGDNSAGKYYVLMSDIDLSGYAPWISIGNTTSTPFRGNFDGNGFVISGLRQGELTTSGGAPVGLFGYVKSHTKTGGIYPGFVTTIKNFTLIDIDIYTAASSPYAAGGVAANVLGYSSPRGSNAEVLIENIGIKKTADYRDVKPYNNVTSPFDDVTKYAAYSATVNAKGWSNDEGVTTTGNRIKGYAAGGIVGMSTNNAEVVIRGCFNEVMVESSSYYSGGIGGWSQSGSSVTVEQCYNIGTIIGGSNSYTGGIFGLIEGSSIATIKSCYNIANIFGGDDTGGILGTCWSSGDKAFIEKCFSVGGVYGHPSSNNGSTSTQKGGLVGYIGGGQLVISDSYFAGTVSNGNTSGLGNGGTGSGVSATDIGKLSEEEIFSEEFLENVLGGEDGDFVLLYDDEGNAYISLKWFNHVGIIVLDANGGYFKGTFAGIAIDTSMSEADFENGIDQANGYIFIKFDELGSIDFDAIDYVGDSGYDKVNGVAFKAHIGETITQEVLDKLNIADWNEQDPSLHFDIPVGTAAGESTANANIEKGGYIFEGWTKAANPVQGTTVYGRNEPFVGAALADSDGFAFYAKWRNEEFYTLAVDNTDNDVVAEVLVYYNDANILPKGDYIVNGDVSKLGARPASIDAGYRYEFVGFYLYNAGEIIMDNFGVATLADAATNLWMIELGQPAQGGALATVIDSSFVTSYITSNSGEFKIKAMFNKIKQSTFSVAAVSGQENRGSAEKQKIDPALGAVESVGFGEAITYDAEGANATTQVKIKAVAEQYYEFVGYKLGDELISDAADLAASGAANWGVLTTFDGADLIVDFVFMDGKQLILVFAPKQYNVEFVAATEDNGVVTEIISGAPTITGASGLTIGIGDDIDGVNAGVVNGWRRADKFNNLKIENIKDSGYDTFTTALNGDVAIAEIGAPFLDKYLDADTIKIYVIYVKQYSITIELDTTNSDTQSGSITFKDFNKNTQTVNAANLSHTAWFDKDDTVRLDVVPFSQDYEILNIQNLDAGETLLNGRVNLTVGDQNRTVIVSFKKKSIDIEVRAIYIEEGTQVNIPDSDFNGGIAYTTTDTLTDVLSGQTVEIARGETGGYSFVGWRKLVNGELVSLTTAAVSTLSYSVNTSDVSGLADAIVLVQEFAKQYQLSITVEGEYDGVADNSSLYSLEMFIGGVKIDIFSLSEIAQNATVKITITNPEYYELNPIVGLATGETAVANPNGTHTVTIVIDGSRDITISFSPIVYNISHNDDLGGARGSLNINAEEVKIGDTIVLSFVVESGYDFDGWQISGKNISEFKDSDGKALAQVSADGKTVTFAVNKEFLDVLLGANGKINIDNTVSTTINKGYLAGILVGVILVPLLVVGAVILAILNGKKKKEYAAAMQKHKESSARLGQADVIKNLLKDKDDTQQGN